MATPLTSHQPARQFISQNCTYMHCSNFKFVHKLCKEQILKMQLTSLALATVLLPVLFQASKVYSNGSFLYTRGPVPAVFKLGEHYPDRNETDQCRPIRLRIRRNSRLYISDLVTNTNPDIIFQNADARVMTSRLQTRLNKLAKRFRRKTGTKITVLKAWSEYSANDSDPDSLHYEGLLI